MGTIPRHWWGAAAFAVITIGVTMLAGVAGWLHLHHPLEFAGLILVVILTSALRDYHSTAEDWAVMPPSFVLDFVALLLFGPQAAMLVATAGIITGQFVHSASPHPVRRILVRGLT